MMIRQHAIYGLYLPDQPDAILYAGSWLVATLDERLRQHRQGEAPMTRKLAARNGVETSDLRMRILAYWMSGGDNPEGKITSVLQSQGQCRWNFPHTLTTADCRKGMSRMSREDHARGGRASGGIAFRRITPEQHRKNSRKGMRTANARMTHAQHRENSRKGSRVANERMTPEERSEKARIAAFRANETWGQTIAAHEHRTRAGRLANCTRWHP